MLRKMLEPKSEKMAEGRGKLRSEELHKLVIKEIIIHIMEFTTT